jgi:serine/threonine protein kinase
VVVNSSSDESLLARLFDVPAGERTTLWEKACAEDPGLRVRLPEIARRLEKPFALRPTLPAALASEDLMRALEYALAPADRENIGTLIGSYKLLQKIGEGGFGSVWMAEQLEPIRRRVALKIVKVGMDTDEVIARFEVERQALALMDHPNIARVFDAGGTDLGRPYFVMELVRGIPITKYCDENRIPTEDRLRMFIAVCHAVQHAHQKGIIHRDLKPSNIIVTLHDGVPIPKIIDFGIAKATVRPLTERTLFTQFHAFIGTPAYTSPEQMEL